MDNYIIKNDKNISYLQFTKLLEYEDIVKHAITLRPIDIGSNDTFYKKEKEAIADYQKICDVLDLDYKDIYRPFQTHTDTVKCINNEKPGIFTEDFQNVDSLITNKEKKILSISVADCIDLLFFDPVKRVIANTHSGWQGTYRLISKKTVQNMVDVYGCNVKDIICCIGPSIRKCHFEVDEDIAFQFHKKFEHLSNINDIITRGEMRDKRQKYNIDTVLINIEALLQMGLRSSNIIDCGLCTVCNSDKFHSYRVNKEASGRNTGIISII